MVVYHLSKKFFPILNMKGAITMEMRIYELLGVKYWKRFVLWFPCLFIRDPEDRKGGNYWLEDISFASIKKFKKQLLFNASLHIGAILVTNIPFFIMNLLDNNIPMMIYQVIFFLVNFCCIMLQRYNWLRIKKILKKISSRK